MIDVKVAAQKAVDYMKGFFPDSEVIRLEEVEITEDRKFWFITLSIIDEEPSVQLAFMDIGSSNTRRVKKYKIFKIEASTGEVLSMKMRDV